ncbi:hypothetical protein [Aeromonas hydrophila]|uniref:hypothetical protein n=1 Tax=Aeromonas hydrophila TaxID=644 RepID=UPI003D20C045
MSILKAFNILDFPGLKHTFIDRDKTEHFNGKCPCCTEVITFYEAHVSDKNYSFKGVDILVNDESGFIFGTCPTCDAKFKIKISNPDYSGFDLGYILDGFYINEQKKSIDIKSADSYALMIDIISRDTTLIEKSAGYDFYNNPLYVCEQCGCNLEHVSYDLLKDSWKGNVTSKLGGYINWSLSSHGPGPSKLLVKFPFNCECNKEHVAIFYSNYKESIDFESYDFALSNIHGAKSLSVSLFGVFTKTNIMSRLYKLLARWNLLCKQIYIITPFVGHQFLSSGDKVNAWMNVLRRLNSKKSSIYVRSGQAKIFKNSFSKINDISYEMMEQFGLGSDLVKDLKGSNGFHAKIYCGVGAGCNEVLNGSSNLVEGPSLEVINFHSFNTCDEVSNIFLAPLKIDVEKDMQRADEKDFSILITWNGSDCSLTELYGNDFSRIVFSANLHSGEHYIDIE